MKKKFLWIICIFTIVITLGYWIFYSKGNSEYKSVDIDGKIMRANVKGSGEKTIVMLSGWGTDSPIDDFFPLHTNLSKNYRVVVLEYFGYFGSDLTEDERTNEIMVQEVRTALKKLDINPPYILMPHSMSGLYSLYYANNYPSEVSAIIGIDMSLPQKQLERWNEETFEKAKLNQKSSNLNISMINQWNKFYDNSKELKDLRYPSSLPVLAFLATEQIETVDEMIKSGTMLTPWTQINTNMITNTDIQTIKVLEGKHYLHHNQFKEIARVSTEFIKNKLK